MEEAALPGFSMLDLQSHGPGFKSCSDWALAGFVLKFSWINFHCPEFKTLVMLIIIIQLVSVASSGFLILLRSILDYLFESNIWLLPVN